MTVAVPWNVVTVLWTLACEVLVLSGSWWNQMAPTFSGWRIIPCRSSLSSSTFSNLLGSLAVCGVEKRSLFRRRRRFRMVSPVLLSSTAGTVSQSSSIVRANTLGSHRRCRDIVSRHFRRPCPRIWINIHEGTGLPVGVRACRGCHRWEDGLILGL